MESCLSSSTTASLNPTGTDGFEFVEFTSPYEGDLEALFLKMGFTPVAKHRTKEVILYRQGKINFLVNRDDPYARAHAAAHGPSACAMAFRVQDAFIADTYTRSLGAQAANSPFTGKECYLPALKGIGNSLLYLVDAKGAQSLYEETFDHFPNVNPFPTGLGLTEIDHLTHNVYQGHLPLWTEFYKKYFHFTEQRSFEIAGQKTGMMSRAMISPCGKIRIPLNESVDNKSQIAEYLKEYKGEGIQHIALATPDIVASVEHLKAQGISFMTVPSTYYSIIDKRLPYHQQDLKRLALHHILLDGEKTDDKVDLLLQIFTQTLIGPIFFEIIQRLGHDGFGQGNITALFEAMEREQEQRGVL